MTEVAFEWVPVKSDNISGYKLYRSNSSTTELVATIKDRFSSHYVDTNLAPNTEYKYELKTYHENGFISKSGKVVAVKTHALLDSVPFVQAIYGLPERVKLLWRPHPDTRVVSYIIERAEVGSGKWRKVASVNGRLNAEYIDADLKSNHKYEYRIFVKTANGTISNPSKVVSATTKPLPVGITNLQASSNLPKKITITWEDNQNTEISHYNIYATSLEFVPYTLLASTNKTKFDDLVDKNGVQKFYKVTAVDRDGLESHKQNSPVVGSTLPAPLPANLVDARFNGDSIELIWDGGNDGRSVKFNVIKSGKTEQTFRNLVQTRFVDNDVEAGEDYTYKIIGIDEFGINSKALKVSVKAR